MCENMTVRIARWYVNEDLHYWSLAMPLLRASMNRRANRTSAWSLFRGRSDGCRKGSGVFLLSGILVATAFAFAQAPNASKNNQATVKPNVVHFENIARQAGLTALNVNGNDKHNVFLIEGTGMGAVIFDYDNDGWPDIFLPNGTRVEGFPKGQEPTGHLYHNNQDGTFTDVTEKAGLGHPGWGQGGCVGDFDNDGWPDVYVSCDTTPNLLYHNNHDGTFTEIGKTAGVAYSEEGSMQAGMGASAGDYTHDGYQDIVKTNFSDDTPTVFLNRGNNTFDDVTRTVGLGRITTWLGWGVQFYDFDNSGWPGVLICNGHIYPEVDGKNLGTSYRQPKVLYYNLHDGKFANITAHAGNTLNEMHSARGLALGDLFNNGREEALVNNMNETPSLYYNTAPVGNFISIQLIGVKSNRAALGAQVTLEQNGDKYQKEIRSGGGFISQSDLRVHFGLGKAEKADKIVIRWPNGLLETLKDLEANRYYVVREGSGMDSKQTRNVNKMQIKTPGG